MFLLAPLLVQVGHMEKNQTSAWMRQKQEGLIVRKLDNRKKIKLLESIYDGENIFKGLFEV